MQRLEPKWERMPPMMTIPDTFVAGLAVGFSVAVPLGPMGLLCIQRTLTSGMRVGICTGLGAATVNIVYGALVIVGLSRMAAVMALGSRVLSFAGGLFLLWCAARTFMRRRLAGDLQAPVAPLSPTMAYGTAVAFNTGNPMSPVLMIALLSPITAVSAPGLGQAAALLIGMFTAAATWWVCLSGTVTLLRSRLSPRVLEGLNQVAAAMLSLYGALALARAVRI